MGRTDQPRNTQHDNSSHRNHSNNSRLRKTMHKQVKSRWCYFRSSCTNNTFTPLTNFFFFRKLFFILLVLVLVMLLLISGRCFVDIHPAVTNVVMSISLVVYCWSSSYINSLLMLNAGHAPLIVELHISIHKSVTKIGPHSKALHFCALCTPIINNSELRVYLDLVEVKFVHENIAVSKETFHIVLLCTNVNDLSPGCTGCWNSASGVGSLRPAQLSEEVHTRYLIHT